jgi:AcrR family transcriptional regulator
MMPQLTRREREKIAKREAILLAAQDVFAEKGFTAATLDEIAEKAEFSKAALYLYFKNKEDLFFSLIETRLGEIRSQIMAIGASDNDPIEKLRNVVKIHFAFHERHRNFFQLFTRVKSALNPDQRLFTRVKSALTPDQLTSEMQDTLQNNLQTSFQAYIDAISAILQDGIEQGCYRFADPHFLAHTLTSLLNSVIFKCEPGSKEEEELKSRYEQTFDIFLYGALKPQC